MKIRVDSLSDMPLHLEAVEPVEDFPALVELQDKGECVFLSPLRLDLTVAREFDHIRMHGRIAAKARFNCSRCLVEFDTDLDTEFTVFYTKKAIAPLEEEVALAEQDLVSVPYEGDTIDFSSEFQEQVLMEIPFKPLCREDCRGLCSNCGSDLNVGECECGRKGSGFTFNALKDFTVKK